LNSIGSIPFFIGWDKTGRGQRLSSREPPLQITLQLNQDVSTLAKAKNTQLHFSLAGHEKNWTKKNPSDRIINN
jgi:hypothetical protein